MFGFLAVIVILGWGILGLWGLSKMEEKQGKPDRRFHLPHLFDEPEDAAFWFILLGVVIAVGGYIILHWQDPLIKIVEDFYANFAAEFISIALTVLIIERLYKRRAENDEKKSLILQMGSPDNAFAVEAARQLKERGWLNDGSLKGADLYKANLSGAVLGGADLREALLVNANLSHAIMWSANLSEAWLIDTDLTGAGLDRAILTGARLGEVDLSGADLKGVDLRDVDLSKATLEGAKYSSSTQWAEDFDPKEAGAIKTGFRQVNREP